MAEHIKHHYIPQCYLKYFGHSKKNSRECNSGHFLYALNVKSLSSYTTSIDNVCQIKNFYRLTEETVSKDAKLNPLTLEIEILAQQIESQYSKILESLYEKKEQFLNKIEDVFPMSKNDKQKIAEFIAIQNLRMPYYRDYLMKMTREVYPQMMNIFKHLVAKVENNPRIAELNLTYKYDEALIHANMGFLNGKFIEPIVNKLFNCKWIFEYSPSKDISTSNNPIVSYSVRDYGLAPSGWNSSIVYFPLFPDILLVVIPPEKDEGIQDCCFSEITEFASTSFHNYLAAQSTEIYNFNNNFENIIHFLNG